MARPRSRTALNVHLNGRLVGRLQREASGAVDFRYDATWLALDDATPVSLSLPLREERFVGEPVIAVFDNLLPDTDRVRRRLAERVRADGHDAYNLLAAIGRDCVGALQFLPPGTEPGPAGVVSGRPITDSEIAQLLADLIRSPLGVTEDAEFRISLAGAQEKTALLRWNGRWHLPHGTTATTHILKPQIGRLRNGLDLSQSVENEHLCMTLVAAIGLPAANTEIADFEDRRVLIVERFDRQWTRDERLLRRPQEDCCQALSVPSSRRYESDGGPGMRQILELLRASDDPEADQRLFLKAQIVFWLLAATDGHAKNFSIHLSAGGRFRLAPLYDVMSAQPNFAANQIKRNSMRLAMAAGTQRHYALDTIMPRHFLQTAQVSRVSPELVRDVFEELLDRVPAALERVLSALPKDFPEAVALPIADGVRRRLRQIERPLA